MLHAGHAGEGDDVSQALLAASEHEGEIVTLQPVAEDPSVLDWENIGVCIYKVGVCVALNGNTRLPWQVLAWVGCCGLASRAALQWQSAAHPAQSGLRAATRQSWLVELHVLRG